MDSVALILAAGEGTRMKSSLPKVAHKLLGKPLINWVIDASHSAGCERVVAILGHERTAVEPLVKETPVIYQEEQLGTGHAVMMAAEELADVDGSVVILNGDSPLIRPETISSLIETRESTGAAVALLTMKLGKPYGYGRIVRDADGAIERIIEEKDCTDSQREIVECNSGVYCFDAKTLFEFLPRLSTNNSQGEYYLTDMIELCNAEGLGVTGVLTDEPDETLGINTRVQLASVTKIAQHRINEKHMLAGVTMLDPTCVWIGPEVVIGRDTEILPNTIIFGDSSVGEHCLLGPSAQIKDSIVGDDCVIDDSIVVESHLEGGVAVGPRAYLRPETHMLQNSKAGCHVEIKKSLIGEGTKVPHLAYVGDTTIGSNTNLGAGTITCNYDGVKKSKTKIGNDVFIGSDTMLIAPVTIGDKAVTAAGSAIAEDVPDKALAMERSEQMNFPGWFE